MQGVGVNAIVDFLKCDADGCGAAIRGPERLLTPRGGGSVYCTSDHYVTFYCVGEFDG